MTTRYSGIVNVTGDPDSGKTRFLLEAAPLSKIALFHDDIKRPPMTDKLGLFVDMVKECQGMKLMEMGQYIVDKIAKIKPDQYDAILFDTWPRVELALRWWGKSHAEQFREVETFAIMGSMKNGEKWKEGDKYTARIINEMASKAKFVGLVTHLKDESVAGAKTGKMIPEGGRILNTACNFRIWLRKNPDSGVPIGLVLKRLAEDILTLDGFLETVNIMPWKLTPSSDDKSIWDTIDRYRAFPYGNREPLETETPDQFEMSILTGIMTPTQQRIWQANLLERQAMDKEELEMVSQEEQTITDFIHSLNGSPLPIIKSKLEAQAKTEGWSQQEFSLGWIAGIIGG